MGLRFAARAVVALTLGIGALASSLPGATPLTADSEAPARKQQNPNASDVLLVDPRELLSPETIGANAQSQILGPLPARAPKTARPQPQFDFGLDLSPDTRALGGTNQDSLRSLVNVWPQSNTVPGTPASASPARAKDFPSLDLGLVSKEWIRDSVREVMTSVMDLNVHERGHASFSSLVIGDSNVTDSASSAEFARAAGSSVFIARPRPGEAALSASAANGGRNYSDPSWEFGGAPSGNQTRPISSTDITPLKRAVELALDIASHPISFIVYALICAYGLLWALLSRRTRHRRHVARRTHDQHRQRSSTRSRQSSSTTEPVVATSRKRVRVRRHRHKTKPSTHRA